MGPRVSRAALNLKSISNEGIKTLNKALVCERAIRKRLGLKVFCWPLHFLQGVYRRYIHHVFMHSLYTTKVQID